MISIIKLMNGTELIGSIVDENTKTITIENPIQINYKNLESSVPSVSLTRFLQFSKDKQHTFDIKNVLCISEPIKEMQRYYEVALNHFESEIDEVVKRELIRVVSSETDTTEMYSAMLERLSGGKALN